MGNGQTHGWEPCSVTPKSSHRTSQPPPPNPLGLHPGSHSPHTQDKAQAPCPLTPCPTHPTRQAPAVHPRYNKRTNADSNLNGTGNKISLKIQLLSQQ